MDKQYYESLFTREYKNLPESEAYWNARAKDFRNTHHRIGEKHSGKMNEWLLGKGLLKGDDVLDIGGGTGRYAVPFAEYANEVTIADISTQMMAYAKENATNIGRDNLQYTKLNWEEANLNELGWEKRFDLVFASMCPAVRSVAGVDKMIAASRGYCQINQFTEMTDNITLKLAQDLGVDMSNEPHNDRNAVQGLFNMLWIRGLEPEIGYIKESNTRELMIDEVRFPPYFRGVKKVASEKGVTIKQLLEGYGTGDRITVESRVTLAMVLWKV